MIVIDGSQGEGGGQIVRTALTLSAVTGAAVRLVKMRANRRPPGLRPQHLAAVRAAAQICGVDLPALDAGVSELSFAPKAIRAGRYKWDIGTAGSACLVLQTVVLPLALAGGPSQVEIVGGTHNPQAPCFEYLAEVWAYWLRRIGVSVKLELLSAGFYPKGGGKIVAVISGGLKRGDLKPLRLHDRGKLRRLTGLSAAANLPAHVAQRQRVSADQHLRRSGLSADIRVEILRSPGVGTVCLLLGEFERSVAAFFALGKRGKPAERVGQEAAVGMADFCGAPSGAAVERYAADQLIVPLSLAGGTSTYTTTEPTEHARTNAAVASRILGREVRVERQPGGSGVVTIA